MSKETLVPEAKQGTALPSTQAQNTSKKLYIESYGCQMNFSDSEIVASILRDQGYDTTDIKEHADLIFLNTCSIRDKAEQTVRKRLSDFQRLKKANPQVKIGLLGCMAERLKAQLLEEEKIVDLVVGPDAYRALPQLVEELQEGRKAVNVLLSLEETYGDITPVRLGPNGVSSFISITRGCDNMCTFCVVPFTRGRERSRDYTSIVAEAKDLEAKGYKEITLLGQNVDSYLWYGGGPKKHFKHLSEMEQATSVNFAQLLEKVAIAVPGMRIRFSTSHPKDMTDEVLHTMAKYDNICKYIHLPFQSGSDRILELMNRGYTKSWYEDRMRAIRQILPECGISHDIIAGFCTETEEDHQKTLELMDFVQFNFGYMFYYSERPNTPAARKMTDDVPLDVKKRRLAEIIKKQRHHSHQRNIASLGNTYEVLVEGISKKSTEHVYGRTSQNTVVVFPKEEYKAGDFVQVYIEDCTSATLLGKAVSE